MGVKGVAIDQDSEAARLCSPDDARISYDRRRRRVGDSGRGR